MNWEILTHESVMFALFGAVAMQLLTLMQLRNVPKTQRPDLKDLFYWLPFIVAPLIGGGLAAAYVYPPDVELEPLVAINIGVSGPLILRAMAEINPFQQSAIDPGSGA